MIRAFQILNENFPPDHRWSGVPFPGTYVVDELGIVRAKYFEEDHKDRYTAANILVRQFDSTEGITWTEVETRHLKLKYSASEFTVRPGNRILLLLDVELKPGMHVYAPGVGGNYIPIEWRVVESTGWLAQPAAYPASEKLHLAVIGETLPVSHGSFRLRCDLMIGQNREIRPLLNAARELTVEGKFRYQACDNKECYLPQSIPLKWVFTAERHDSQRAPVELRRAP
jgi:hypothetical protein